MADQLLTIKEASPLLLTVKEATRFMGFKSPSSFMRIRKMYPHKLHEIRPLDPRSNPKFLVSELEALIHFRAHWFDDFDFMA